MRPNVPPPPIRLYFSFLLEKEKKGDQSFLLFFHVRTALSCIERFFVLYTTLRKTNFLCIVPFFTSKGGPPYDATVGCPECTQGVNSDRIGLCVPGPSGVIFWPSLPYLRPLCYATVIFCYAPPRLRQK